MSTTNPPAGPDNPGGDPPRPPGTQPPGPTPGQWPADVTDLSAPDLPATGPGVNPDAVRAGHEPDAFYVKPILSIPLAVVVSFVIAFVVAAGVFAYFMGNVTPNPLAHPEAIARGEAPLNQRLERIDREGLDENELREEDQPRLEPLKRLEGNGQTFTRPELPTGNSPQIHPEEIHPSRVTALQTARWVEQGKIARIPIADAMRIAAGNKEVLPVRENPSRPVGTAVRPSSSSAGRGVVPLAPKVEAKKQPEKKDQAKKEPQKKEPEKKVPEKKDQAGKEPAKKEPPPKTPEPKTTTPEKK